MRKKYNQNTNLRQTPKDMKQKVEDKINNLGGLFFIAFFFLMQTPIPKLSCNKRRLMKGGGGSKTVNRT